MAEVESKFPPLPQREALCAEIEEYAEKNETTLLTAVIEVFDKYGLDAENNAHLLPKPLVARIEVEATDAHMMKERHTTYKLV